MPAPELRRARAATATLFAVNGALFANLLPRYPEIKTDLGMTNTVLGLTVAAFPAGALLFGPVAGALLRRFGSARVAVVTGVALAVLLCAAALAPTPALLAGALLLAGGADAVTDVAQNAQGLAVQRRYGRSIINSLHATWSIGAVCGGLMGAAAVAAGLPRGAQLAVSGLLFGAVCLAMLPLLLPAGADGSDERGTSEEGARSIDADGSDERGTSEEGARSIDADGSDERAVRADAPGAARPRPGSRAVLTLAVLSALGVAGAAVEDVGSSWSAIYLHEVLAVPAAAAAFGYVALVGAQFVGRVFGDRLIDRFGEAAVVRAGGLLAAAGMGAALAFPSAPAVIVGFGAAGLGVSVVIPAAYHGADNVAGLRPGAGLTVVSWVMRFGFMCGPPIVGAIADSAGLRAGLLVVPVAGLVIAAGAGVLGRRRGADAG
ncbi:MFS transporter [Mycolicibacterium brumae]|uniref:MFS transporter n=1 Tax=Mycolicibacterium brumae TaxID=85968 RepID=A0A2G5PE40_9MYCO|nr:MFS transporter [Mycolicibacterium brumae]PIB76601.1 MFS transporter [Mycolicibacterium brumae]